MIFPKLKLKVDAVCTFGPDHSQNSSTLRPHSYLKKTPIALN